MSADWRPAVRRSRGDRVDPARAKAHRHTSASATASDVLGTADASLLDVVDNVLSKGVVLSGDLTIALAQVDLIYARIALLLCAADRVLPHEDTDATTRHARRRLARARPGSGA